MRNGHLGPVLSMRVPDPAWRARYPGDVGSEKMQSGLYHIGVTSGIGVTGRLLRCRFATLEHRIGIERQTQRRGQRSLDNRKSVLRRILSSFAEITKSCAQEELAAFWHTRNALLVYKRSRRVDALQLLNGKPAIP